MRRGTGGGRSSWRPRDGSSRRCRFDFPRLDARTRRPASRALSRQQDARRIRRRGAVAGRAEDLAARRGAWVCTATCLPRFRADPRSISPGGVSPTASAMRLRTELALGVAVLLVLAVLAATLGQRRNRSPSQDFRRSTYLAGPHGATGPGGRSSEAGCPGQAIPAKRSRELDRSSMQPPTGLRLRCWTRARASARVRWTIFSISVSGWTWCWRGPAPLA